MASTEKIQAAVNFATTHVDLMPIANVGGFANEPALSIAKNTIQELLSPPYDWKFNSKVAGLLTTQQYRQDYLFAGATAFVQNYAGVSIDLASNNAITESSFTVTVKCLQPHNFQVGQTVFMTGNTLAAYNSTLTTNFVNSLWSGGWTITATPDALTFQFIHASSGLGTSGAPGITDASWIESCTMIDTSDTSPVPRVWDVFGRKKLKASSMLGRPIKIALISDNGAGVIGLRLAYVPGSPVWGITVVYQQKAPTLKSLDDTWAPFPDEYGFVYRQMFLAQCYRYLNSAKADAEFQKAAAMVMKGLGKDDTEMTDQHVSPEISIMDGWEW